MCLNPVVRNIISPGITRWVSISKSDLSVRWVWPLLIHAQPALASFEQQSTELAVAGRLALPPLKLMNTRGTVNSTFTARRASPRPPFVVRFYAGVMLKCNNGTQIELHS